MSWSVRAVGTLVFGLVVVSDHSWDFTSHHLVRAPIFGSTLNWMEGLGS